VTQSMKRFNDHDWTGVNAPFGSVVTTLGREEFALRYSGRYLCVLMDEGGTEDTPSFGTLCGGELPKSPARNLHVFPLVKRAANPFSMMITFGRAPNNDLHIELGQVSKFHGYFSQARDDWQVTDAGSTNGTYLEGARLAHREAVKIEVGSELLLGAVPAWYVDGEGLFDLLLEKKIPSSAV
jgi:FHA domain-containing protein